MADTKTEVRFAEHEYIPVVPPRPLTMWERGMVGQLLSVPFAESDALLRQLDAARVVSRCTCGCLSYDLVVQDMRDDAVPAHLGEGGAELVAEQHGSDVDGMFVWALLFVRDGRLAIVEVIRGDGGPFVGLPPLDTFEPALRRWS